MSKTARERRRYLIVSLIVASLMAILFVSFLIDAGLPVARSAPLGRALYPVISADGPSYVTVTEYFRGEGVALAKWRVSRPIVPLLALPLSYAVSTEFSFVLINSLLFVLLVGIFFDLALHLLTTPKQAFYAAILLVFAFPVYYRGINVTVDLASWLIFVATARVLIALERRNAVTIAAFSVLAMMAALGTLVTELVFASFLLILGFYLIRHRRDLSVRRLLRDFVIICASFASVVIVLQVTIYLIFDYSFFDKAQKVMNWNAMHPLNLGPAGFVRAFVGAFLASLLLLPLGLLEAARSIRHRELVSAILISALLALAAIYTNTIRFVFVLFPVVFPVAVLGIGRLARIVESVPRFGSRGALITEVALLSAACAFSLLTYSAFVHYGGTEELAHRFLQFLL